MAPRAIISYDDTQTDHDALMLGRILGDAGATLMLAYGELKIGLAERHREDRDAYAEGKTAFITAALGERSGQRRARRK